ncbi:RNase H domain-containing protein [Abeliophyllum distichum]|uniref:RNase H domain-containing protein n=1 Tax=Abeliophyllum distichum TaxID=126358 RepID=A0ABD1V897_9LAMI
MIPVEVGIPSLRHLHFNEVINDDLGRANLDLQEKRHDDSQLRLVFLANREVGAGTLGPKWEGPYKIIEKVRLGTYRLEDSEGRGQDIPGTLPTYVRTISSFFCFFVFQR